MNTLQFLPCFLILATTDAFHRLIPSDREVIFLWRADIKAGVPVPHASQFALQGKIHLQPHNNTVYVKFSDLTHRVYNGIFDNFHEYKVKNLSLPHEVRDLEKTFKITYTEEGIIDGISTQSKEKEFSRNIKKAVASIFQMNATVLLSERRIMTHHYVKENSIYEHGIESYAVFPLAGQTVEVRKSRKMRHGENVYSFEGDTERTPCGLKHERTEYDILKIYLLDKEGDFYVVKNISLIGAIAYYPYKAQPDAQEIMISQNFDLMTVVPIVEKFQVDDEYFEKNLKYCPFVEQKEGILDETNGRRNIDYEKLIPLVSNMLIDIRQYMDEDHISTKQPDSKHNLLVSHVQQILRKFSSKKLEELRTALPASALNVFYHILPLVTTEASTLYIKTLILNKIVEDDLAIELLQNMGKYIRPSLDLIEKLEDLIHLPSTFSWNLQKVAILNFGSFIYKSYLHQQVKSKQKPYEKYIEEYVRNLRNSSSYVVQLTYLLGLRNMKLPILAHRLIPAFNGEWWSNQHLRYLALGAAAEPIFNSFTLDQAAEIFSDLLTNRSEKIEIRAFAYYFLMYSRPELPLLRSIFEYMLTEPDDELYRIHYTLVQTLMKSHDPRHQKIRSRLGQVVKLSPPPRGGVSAINFFGYRDEEFGFGAGIQSYYLKTDELRIYTYYVTSEFLCDYETEWAIYWKIYDGREKDPGFIESIYDIIGNKSDSNFHIEVSIARRGQVINTYAFDKNNLKDLMYFQKYLVFDTLSSSFLYINHQKYNSYLVPTDLGIPVFWQYFMPVVHYNNLIVSEQVADANRKFQVENKYGAWIHYRHGLTFYNPIADIWQGINKYHTYDALVPLHFNGSLDFKWDNLEAIWKYLEVHWQKHYDPQMNTIGFRTHTRQVVFATDFYDYEKKVLEKFMPNGEEFQTVGCGERLKNYTLIDKENLDSGHRLYLANYDSNIQEPYRTFKKQLLKFANATTKYFQSPLQHWVLSWLHFHRDMVLLPRPGSYGFVARIEPTCNVTNINFILHQRFDNVVNNTHLPGLNVHSNMTYSTKSDGKFLKAWELNSLVKIAAGHNSSSWKLELSRILPEQTNYKICIEGYKKWGSEEVTGFSSVSIGESDSERCSNDTVIYIRSNSRRSFEQTKGTYKNTSCSYIAPHSDQYYHSVECLLTHSTFRHSTYKVTTSNLPPWLKETVTNLGNDLRDFFQWYNYSYNPVHNENVTKDSFQVDVIFPIKTSKVKIEISTAERIYEFPAVPLKYLNWFNVRPDSTTFPSVFIEKYRNGEIDHCIVNWDSRYLNKKYVPEVVPDTWTLYLESGGHVYLKQLNQKIAMKVVHEERALEVEPSPGRELQMTIGGNVSSSEEYEEYWVHYRLFRQDNNISVAIFLKQMGVYLHYDVHHVVITIPQGNQWRWNGQCYSGIET